METKETKKVNKTIKGKLKIKNIKEKLPEHLVNLVSIVRNNTEIRRFTSLGIIKYLKDLNVILGEKNYVNFYWTKFKVTSDGLSVEFRYNEDFFINALAKSFESFSLNAQRTINEFVNVENNNSPVKENTESTTDNVEVDNK